MDYVFWFAGGVIIGAVVAVLSMLALFHYLNKLIDADEDFRQINGR